MDLSKLSSPFYRVSIKLIILNDDNKLLVAQSKSGHWEMPGGGFEHEETIKDCVERELEEELGVKLAALGKVRFVYRGLNPRGFRSLKIAVEASLKNYDFNFGDHPKAKFVNKDELATLNMNSDESGIKGCSDLIWPATA